MGRDAAQTDDGRYRLLVEVLGCGKSGRSGILGRLFIANCGCCAAQRHDIGRPRRRSRSGSIPHDRDRACIDRHCSVFKLLVNGWQRRGSAKSDRKGSKSARLRRNRVARRIRSGYCENAMHWTRSRNLQRIKICSSPRVLCPASCLIFHQECAMMASEDFVPPLAANMTAAFKNVRGVMGDDPTLRDQIATKIVELAKVGVYDVEELSRRTLNSLKLLG
jgi:hypothetical protein